MINKTNQQNINISGNGNKNIGRDDNSTTNITYNSNSKLSSLFLKLKEKFEKDDKISEISDNLKRYTNRRDTIGLEQKLNDADISYFLTFLSGRR